MKEIKIKLCTLLMNKPRYYGIQIYTMVLVLLDQWQYQTCYKKTHIIELNSIILLLPNVQMLNIVLKQVE